MKQIVLAKRMGGTGESATLALNARAKQLAAEGKTVYNLTAGELATDTPLYIQTAVAKTLHENKYTPVAGLPSLREAIAEGARTFYGLDWIKPANVVVTAAAKPALYASLLALLDPGDEVILPFPAWVSYQALIELVGAIVVPVPLTDDFDLAPAAILSKVSPRTKAIILNSPHNPTGAVFSKASLTELATGLKGSDVTVIADDMYAKLVYVADFTPVPSAGFEQVIIVNGFSKSQALTGWRIGFVIADEAAAGAITNLLSHITGNAALPSQHAALAAMAHHDVPPEATLVALQRQRLLVDEALNDIPGLKHHLPGGAFYVFIDVRAITADSTQWCERLLAETGVALVPGEAFGTPGFARLSFVADEETLRTALKQIKHFVTKGATA
jgi:aspartate aminotransferase